MEFIYLYGVGLIATAIGTMAGGGGMISLPAMMLLGMPIHSAIGANKVSNTFSSLSSFFVVYRNKQVTIKEVLRVMPFSLSGGIAGSWAAVRIPPEQLEWIAVSLLAGAFLLSFVRPGKPAGEQAFTLSPKRAAGLFGIGMYDGSFGPGGGTLMMLLYAQINLAYIRAVGLTRAAIFSSCLGAAVTYILSGAIIWPLTAALLLGSLSGAQLGVRLAGKLKQQQVKPLLRVVTALLISQFVIQQFIG